MDPSCAQPSAIGNLLNGVTSSQRQLGDLSLGGAAANINLLDAQKHGGGVDHMHHRMGPSGPVHSDVSHFINAFDKGPQLERPMHPMTQHHPMMHHPPPFAGPGPGPMQMQRPPMMHAHAHTHAPPSADSLVAEFAQVNMQDQFERLYAAPPHQGQPQHTMPAPQAAAWAAEFEQRQRHMQHVHHMNQQHFRTPFQPQTSVSGQWVDEFDDVNSFVKQQEQKHHQQTFEDVYQQTATPQVQGDGWANEFEQEQKANVGMGMGMGMDKDTIEKLMNSDDPKWRNSKFLKFIKQISSGEVEFRDNQVVPKQPQVQDWAAEFAANDQAAQRAMEQQAMPQGVDWASEFAQGVDDDAWAAEYDADVKNDWASQFSQEQMAQGEAWANEFMREQRLQGEPYTQIDWVKAMEEAKHGVTPQKDPEYEFAQENPFRDHANPYEEGIRLLENGKLKQAILAFEAEVQRNPENAEAWRYLGQAQAENESETHAIAALLKAVHHDPYNLKALMMLGVSYTNDLEEKRALNYLKTWITNHPDYQQSSMAQHKAALEEYENLYSDPNHQSPFDANLHQEVTRLFHNAVQINSRDPELHTVLGVLYHISNDFDKSIEEFKQALKLRPDDPQLWNKLGATQANSSRSAEAVHAYRRALQLRPTYVRASANLAISFANQGLHEDAVRMYLSTLSQNPDANHIWAYLRISLSHLNKDDLVELTQRKNTELFRPYYQF